VGVGLGLSACTGDAPRGGAGYADPTAGRPATPIKLDHFGYRPGDRKVAVFSSDPGQVVRIRSSSGAVVLTVPADGGSISSRGRDFASGDEVWWVDLGRLEAPGRYHLWSASLQAQSYDFSVAPGVYRDVLRAALRTFYLQR
jgi:endoglucanase